MIISSLAGKSPPLATLANVPRLVTSYFTEVPNPSIPAQLVVFGISGHRGCSFERSFNEWHVLAITQSICRYRKPRGIDGPLFLGFDTHTLSVPAYSSALEVLVANDVEVMLARNDDYTPTPVVSDAILKYNRGRSAGLAYGIVITPSHNPPDKGGFKYNPPNGGPADEKVTTWIEAVANGFLEHNLKRVKRVPVSRALRAATTHRHDFLRAYVSDLGQVIDMDMLVGVGLHIGVDPLGGAGVHYGSPIAERYGLNLGVVNDKVDPTFRFIAADWGGRTPIDPSSRYARQTLIDARDRFDIALACNTGHDRHGIVTPSAGLIPPNHYPAVGVVYVYRHRPRWPGHAAAGKSIVTGQMIDCVTAKLGRVLYEVPVGFKWFVDGLLKASLGFSGEESAAAALLRRDGRVWTTDKDGIVPALLAAEITVQTGRDPGEIYRALTQELGEPAELHVQAAATPKQRNLLARPSARQFRPTKLAGETVERVLDRAPGNDAAIEDLKVITKNAWFAARPSGTEDIYKIYAESYRGENHMQRVVEEAQALVDGALSVKRLR